MWTSVIASRGALEVFSRDDLFDVAGAEIRPGGEAVDDPALVVAVGDVDG